MIEAAIELTKGKIEGWQIQTMIDYANDMRLATIDQLPDLLAQLAARQAWLPNVS